MKTEYIFNTKQVKQNKTASAALAAYRAQMKGSHNMNTWAAWPLATQWSLKGGMLLMFWAVYLY